MRKNTRKTAKTETVATVENVAKNALVAVETVEQVHVETDAEREARERREFNDAVASYRVALLASVDVRSAFETAKNADNLSMQAKLKELRASVDHVAIATVMFAASCDSNFINRAERATHRFNIYSARKVVNIARACASAETLNHYTKAILATCVQLEKASLALTNADADVACSLSVKSADASRAKYIVQYQSHVDAKTAATQASSSVNALQTMNVLRVSRDAANRECFVLNTDNVVTHKLLSLL